MSSGVDAVLVFLRRRKGLSWKQARLINELPLQQCHTLQRGKSTKKRLEGVRLGALTSMRRPSLRVQLVFMCLMSCSCSESSVSISIRNDSAG